MMIRKKLLPTVLTAAFMLTAARQAAVPDAFANSRVSFYAGDAIVNEYEHKDPQKISSVKVPEGCSTALYTSDKKRADGTLAPADTKTVTVTKIHQGAGWYINGKKAGTTALNYKQGSAKGTLQAEVLPALQLQAVKKSAKVSGGKLKLTVKYKNSSDSDIIVEGVDTSTAQIQYEGDPAPSKEAVIPPRWTAKKVTIPAGKTKSITVTEPAAKSGKIKKCSYPSLYFLYQGSYFSTAIRASEPAGYIDYHGKTPFKDFAK